MTKANELADNLVQQVTDNSFLYSKNICSQYEDIVARINSVPEDTDELVELTDYIDNLRFGPLLSLKVGTFFTQLKRISHLGMHS